jgi:hypothetical protein
MSPTVTAAIIAASVGFVTLIGTLATQFYGIRRTSRDTLNARFATAADKLGSSAPAVRLAGVYAMAGLADDWEANRQTCVDVLCGYLRMPYEPDPGVEAPMEKQLDFRGSREVRHTVIRVITAHLKHDVAVSWQGLNLDFTGVVFDGGDFSGAKFSGGTVNFSGAEFSGGEVYHAKFSGGRVFFRNAKFSGNEVTFDGAKFSAGTVDFSGAEFSGGQVSFRDADDWSVPPAFPWTGTPPPGAMPLRVYRKITRSFLVSGRLAWYGRGGSYPGDAGGEVRGDLPAPG